MQLEENKAIARRFAQVWGKGELAIIDELASPALTVYYPPFSQVAKGIEAFKQEVIGFRSTFTDADFPIEEEIAEGDKVVFRWSCSGTHQGNLFGVPGTGKRIKWTGITIYRIVDGKVMEERGEEDFLSILRQIGLIPEPQTP
jgi:steroid delta-isomerase-like uncharacterized protein